jgi:hypothetical protein
MDSSALVMSCHAAKSEIPWIQKLQDINWLSSIGFGGYNVKNTFLDKANDVELGGTRRHHSEPKLPSSFASTELGEERQLPSFLLPSSFGSTDRSFLSDASAHDKMPSSFISSDRMEGTKIVHEIANEEMVGVSQFDVTAVSDAVSIEGFSNTCHPEGSGSSSSNEPFSRKKQVHAPTTPQDTGSTESQHQAIRRHSCMAALTTDVDIAEKESECVSERKVSLDSMPGDHDVSNKNTTEGTSPVDEMPWDDNVTTVMIRQLPLHCTQAMLMAEVTNRGFGDLFDFLYLPSDLKKGENLGYGFVNFIEPMYALACRDAFDGTYLPRLLRRKPLNVQPARLQGYEANYKHFAFAKMGNKQIPSRFSPVFLPRDSSSAWVMMSRKPTNPKHSKASNFQKGRASQQNQKPQHMFCHMCGTKQPVGLQFCANCGVGHDMTNFNKFA